MKTLFAGSIAVLLLFVMVVDLAAQSNYYPSNEFTVKIHGQSAALAWAGGLNNPQFSGVDLNNDGITDMVIFDRSGERLLTLINQGTPNQTDYVYAPQYEANFPELMSWALLEDFNCDGIADIFTYLPGKIAVYQGAYNASNQIEFTLFTDQLKFNSFGSPVGIPVNTIDIPAFTDIDNDGDIDVLAPSDFGSFIVFYQNLSVEDGHGCDSLYFDDADACWGKFVEDGSKPSVQLNFNCKQGGNFRHTGTTLLAFDADGDQDKELLLGDVSYNNIIFLENGGDTSSAFMTSQDTTFPSYNVPLLLQQFPASFYMDVNNDNKKDLLFSPNHLDNPIEFSDSYHNVHFYQEVGQGANLEFEYRMDSFLTKDMLEVGSGAYPVFLDQNQDGLLDLLIGNNGYYRNNQVISSLTLLINTGTPTQPEFTLTERDFAGLSVYGYRHLTPTLGDLDADGDEDMIVGDINGDLHYLQNVAGAGNPMIFGVPQLNYQGINAGQYSAPQLVDVNRDNLLDLLIGKKDGTVTYYQNIGLSTAPIFALVTNSFGSVDVKSPGFFTGYATPHLTSFDGDSTYVLLMGSQHGQIYLYDNIDNNLAGAFNLVSNKYSGMDGGGFSSVAGADVTSNGHLEFVVGNLRGGMHLYTKALPVADFSFVAGCLGDTTFFMDQSVNASAWQWYFEDSLTGWLDSSSFQHPKLVLDSLHTYKVTLVATNSNGTTQVTQYVPINTLAPQAAYSFNVGSGQVILENHSISGTHFYWDFGDGHADTVAAMQFTHQYAVDSVYSVTLITSNSCGSDTMSQQVSITGVGIASLPLKEVVVQVLPNPNEGHFEVRLGPVAAPVTLSLMQLDGRILATKFVSPSSNAQVLHWDQQILPAGMYLLKISGQRTNSYEKVVVY